MPKSLFLALSAAAATFGAGPAAAQAAAAPEAVMVFFDWGKFEIQRDYASQLDTVAQAAVAQSAARVMVEGHSDRSGPAAANLKGSLQRANIVRDYMIAHGVPGTRIDVTGVGEEGALIPTADGVREPQNRRVDVRMVLPSVG
jgi:outer membrane protein OmpA-like peptidoglycan-associated protein